MHAPRLNRVVRIEGRRPVVAVGALICEVGRAPVPRGRQKDAVAVGIAGYQYSVYCVQGSPGPCAIIAQLRPLRISRHSPIPPKFHVSDIVFRF